MIQMRVALALAVVLCFGSLMARADSVPILTVSHAGTSTPVGGDVGTPAEAQYVGISFELDRAFDGVAISIPNMGFHNWGGTAWLTDAIGPLTTSANVIASEAFGPVTGDSAVNEDYTFLAGLDLTPGTYFFFLSSPVCATIGGSLPVCGAGEGGLGLWPDAGPASAVYTAPGVSFLGGEYSGGCLNLSCGVNSALPPASSWRFSKEGQAFEITDGDVPEPETIVLFLTGLLLIGLSRLQRRAFKRK